MICIKCKQEIPDGSLYCNHCGKKQSAKERRKALKRPNGMGTVYKVEGKTINPWAAARKKVFLGYFPTRADAMRALERTASIPLDQRYNMTFEDVFKAWKVEHYREIGQKGIESYDRAFEVFRPLHKRKFRNLRTLDYQTVLELHIGKSHSALSKYKQLITQMSRWAMREEIITTNFASFVWIPEDKRKEKEIFSDADIAKLEATAKTGKRESETARIILMLIYTGMRIGELFALPLTGYYKTYCIGGEKTEAGRDRVIPIRPEGRGYFAYFASIADGELLLSGYSGNLDAQNFRKRNYYPLLKKLGIRRMTPHATRHTYASRARAAGMKPEVLQKILGHASYTTTANIYVHTDIDMLVKAVEGKPEES